MSVISPRSPTDVATSGGQMRTISSSPSRLQAPDATQCIMTAASGGTQLQAPGSVNTNAVSAVIRNNSGNAPMYVGSITTPPFSGKGFLLGGGDGLTLNVSDITIIRVVAATSGQRLSYIWSQL